MEKIENILITALGEAIRPNETESVVLCSVKVKISSTNEKTEKKFFQVESIDMEISKEVYNELMKSIEPEIKKQLTAKNYEL